MRKPSASMVVAGAALFVALGGVGVAATGGNFILGTPNTSENTTELSSGVTTGPTLELSNTGNRPAAKFDAGNGAQPFIVGNGVKVSNLNVDKLDGLSSESFTQGGGRFYTAHRDSVALGTSGTLLDIPGAIKVTYRCGDPTYGDKAFVFVDARNLFVTSDDVSSNPPYDSVGSFSGGNWGLYGQSLMRHLMGSRPFNRMTFEPSVLVDERVAGEWRQPTGKCYFQAVAEVFG